MPIGYNDRGKWKFAFVPEYADCIARVASVWARLEYDVSASIWMLAGVRPAMGACITSQIFTLRGRLDALLALAKLRRVDPVIIKKINRFADDVRGGQEIRNRIIHDQWLQDNLNPGQMGHLRITAAKVLEFEIKPVIFPDLAADLDKLEDFQRRFHGIRREIEAALLTLPEIPQSELHPIRENPEVQ
jgi:hypothetical protein